VRKAAIALLLLSLGAAVLASGDALAAAFYRNLGHLSLLGGSGPCGDGVPSSLVRTVEQAVRLRGNGASGWRSLLRVKGWSDRQWIRDALGESPPDWVDPAALRRATGTLRPASWEMEQPWTEERCRAAWDAWTLGLVWVLEGRWTEAVAAYQAGLGLAPGRVPGEIVQEYYLALARHTLSAPDLAASEFLAAAKYLALAGERAEGADLFRALLAGAALDPARACEAERWLAWEGDGGLPPGPGACGSPGSGPDWVLPEESTVADEAVGRVLWGFDLDADILEAGAEVLGTLYWRAPDGQVTLENVRQANLWPNSGNSWLRLEGFSSCLPGYAEPPWVTPCASSVAKQLTRRQTLESFGHIYVPPSDKGPDTFIGTASVPIPRYAWLVYGGWWQSEGNLPRARLARYGGENSNPRIYYETLIDLSNLLPGEWEAKTNVIAPIGQEHDFSGWIQPRFGTGDGGLAFDDLFGFVVEEP
jgi:hypothetical protein